MHSFFITLDHHRGFIPMRSEDKGSVSLDKAGFYVLRRLSRKTKSNIEAVWGGGLTKAGKNHLHMLISFDRSLKEDEARTAYFEAVNACLRDQYDWDRSNLGFQAVKPGSYERALRYVQSDKNSEVVGFFRLTPRNEESKKRKDRRRRRKKALVG